MIAIIMTIMVLELRAPLGASLTDLKPLIPIFVSYLLSFAFLAIYWNNHHHLLHSIGRIAGGVLWANMNLLFWLSLVPFTTAWMGEHSFAPVPVATYGVVLLAAAISYHVLTLALVRVEGRDSVVARALGRDLKGKLSIGLYLVGLILAVFAPLFAFTIYVLVALIWLVPDRRFESKSG